MFPLGYRIGGLPAPREAIKRDNDLTPSRACVASKLLPPGLHECMGMQSRAQGAGRRGAQQAGSV